MSMLSRKARRQERAALVRECATKVGAWSTAHLRHEDALLVQAELIKISHYLDARSKAIEAGSVTGLYE